MEPDEIQKIYTTNMTYITSNPSGGYTLRDAYDLSHVSTRDLLNECYRRRAIEKFSFTDNIDQDFLTMNTKEYITHDAMHCLWKSIYKDQKFLQDALMINEKSDIAYRRVNITGEIYVCKHPTKVRK